MKKARALIVEDDRNIAQLFSTVLHRAGFENEIYQTGLTALQRLPYAEPDLIIQDLGLPDIKGVEVLRLIRADRRFANTPIFVVTAHWEESESKEVQEFADLVLLKPISVSQLFDLATRYRPKASEMRTGLSPRAPLALGYAN